MPDAICRVEINGSPATNADLRLFAATNYGHFTSMQVEQRGVRGLHLHLDRLEHATRVLFGSALDRELVRACMRHAIGDDAQSLSLRVNVFARGFDREDPGSSVQPGVLVAVGAPARASTTALRAQAFVFERTLPQVKHVGTFPLFHHRRLAQDNGFDDALFVDRNGMVAEGSIWNVGFVDGARVVWPDAPQLRGTSMQLLQAGMARRGIDAVVRPVALADIAMFRAAFFTNSSQPIRPLSAIDDVEFAIDETLNAELAACYDSNPLDVI